MFSDRLGEQLSMKARRLARFWNRSPRQLSALMLLLLLLIAGCDGGRAGQGAIHGKVTLNGKPLAKGSILFTPIEGTHGAVAGGEIENGRYEFSGATGPAIGWNRVEIRAARKTGKMIPKPFAPPGQMIPEQVEAVSPQYNTSSTLKVEIKPGENTADFEVASSVVPTKR
jgi:hypothetical protein